MRCCCGSRRRPLVADAPAGRPADAPSGRTADALVSAAAAGDPRALARLISLVENGSPQLREVMKLIAPRTGQAWVIGLTGARREQPHDLP